MDITDTCNNHGHGENSYEHFLSPSFTVRLYASTVARLQHCYSPLSVHYGPLRRHDHNVSTPLSHSLGVSAEGRPAAVLL